MCGQSTATGHRQSNNWTQGDRGGVQQPTSYRNETRLRKFPWLRQHNSTLKVVTEERPPLEYNGHMIPPLVPDPMHEFDSVHNSQAPLQPSYHVGAPENIIDHHFRPSTSDLSLPQVTVTHYPDAPQLPPTPKIGSPSLWQQLAPSVEAIMAAPAKSPANKRSQRRGHRRTTSEPNFSQPPMAGSFELPASSSQCPGIGRTRHASIPSLDMLAKQFVGRPREVDADTATLNSCVFPADATGEALPQPLRVNPRAASKLPASNKHQRKSTRPMPKGDSLDLHLDSAPTWLSKYTLNAASDPPSHLKALETNCNSLPPLAQATTFPSASQSPTTGMASFKLSATDQTTVNGHLAPPSHHSTHPHRRFVTNTFTSYFPPHAQPQTLASSAQRNNADIAQQTPRFYDSVPTSEEHDSFNYTRPSSKPSSPQLDAYPVESGYDNKKLPAEPATGGIYRARKRAEKKQKKGSFMDRLFGLRRE